MPPATPLPETLVRRYRDWHGTTFAGSRDRFRDLVENGQHPPAMVIACCDSRVHATEILGAAPGDVFMHRNIANLVPPSGSSGHGPATAAAVEYAVTALRVAHLIVLGHSLCGGVKGCYQMCEGKAPELEAPGSFVGRWVDILKPAYAGLPEGEEATRLTAFEKAGVRTSLDNLMTFPFVAEAVEAGRLSLHGLHIDIAEGSLTMLDAASDSFVPV